MSKKRVHFVFLVLFQLLVFLAPGMIKATHHHAIGRYNPELAGSAKTFSKASSACAICNFEFVTSFPSDESRFGLLKLATRIENTDLIQQTFKPSFSSCLLRAPPVA